MGGRITLFQTCLPTSGPGKLAHRESSGMSAGSKDVQLLNPSTDFYKRLALDCAGEQIAIDIFLLAGQYSDLASLCKNFMLLSMFVRVIFPFWEILQTNLNQNTISVNYIGFFFFFLKKPVKLLENGDSSCVRYIFASVFCMSKGEHF